MSILDAVQERYGPRYATLEDALDWWAWPEHWRGGTWNEHVLGITTGKMRFEGRLKQEEKRMEKTILEALQEMTGETCDTMEQALEHHCRRELLDYWMQCEGLIGYTRTILHVMEALGYDVDTEQ